MKRVSAQATLELVIAFIGVMLFFTGIVRLWVWSDSKIVGRTPAYNQTRLDAGNEYPGFWGDSNEGVYTPKELTDEWVFKGDASQGANPQNHFPQGLPRRLPFASWCVDGNCSSSASSSVTSSGYDWDFVVDIGNYDLTDCSEIEEALNEVNSALDEANDALPDIEEQLNYWRARYNEADRQARSLQGSSNQEGYATITFIDEYWWDIGRDECTATASPCVSGCTLSCCTQDCRSRWGWRYWNCVPRGCHAITVSSGFGSYEEMAERYYYYYLITSGFTMDVRARDYFWRNETEYRWFDNPYGRGWYGETWRSWGSWTMNFRYHPGYLDWVARRNYAQGERDKFQEAYDDTVDAINKLNEQKATLEEAYSENGC